MACRCPFDMHALVPAAFTRRDAHRRSRQRQLVRQEANQFPVCRSFDRGRSDPDFERLAVEAGTSGMSGPR